MSKKKGRGSGREAKYRLVAIATAGDTSWKIDLKIVKSEDGQTVPGKVVVLDQGCPPSGEMDVPAGGTIIDVSFTDQDRTVNFSVKSVTEKDGITNPFVETSSLRLSAKEAGEAQYELLATATRLLNEWALYLKVVKGNSSQPIGVHVKIYDEGNGEHDCNVAGGTGSVIRLPIADKTRNVRFVVESVNIGGGRIIYPNVKTTTVVLEKEDVLKGVLGYDIEQIVNRVHDLSNDGKTGTHWNAHITVYIKKEGAVPKAIPARVVVHDDRTPWTVDVNESGVDILLPSKREDREVVFSANAVWLGGMWINIDEKRETLKLQGVPDREIPKASAGSPGNDEGFFGLLARLFK